MCSYFSAFLAIFTAAFIMPLAPCTLYFLAWFATARLPLMPIVTIALAEATDAAVDFVVEVTMEPGMTSPAFILPTTRADVAIAPVEWGLEWPGPMKNAAVAEDAFCLRPQKWASLSASSVEWGTRRQAGEQMQRARGRRTRDVRGRVSIMRGVRR